MLPVYKKYILEITVFVNLASDKPPYHVQITNSKIICNVGNVNSYTYKGKKSKDVYNNIVRIFSNNSMKLFPGVEIETATKEECIDDVEDWSSIKKKGVKDLLVEMYVMRMKNKYSLSFTQTRNLLSLLLLSIVFKTITVDDINYSNRRIESIKGIDFELGTIHISEDIEKIDIKQKNEDKTVSKIDFGEQWEKYTMNLVKKIKMIS